MTCFKKVVCVIGVLALALPVFGGYLNHYTLYTELLDINCDAYENEILPTGKPLDFWDICGSYGRVTVKIGNFPVETFPWSLTTYIDDIENHKNSSFTITIDETALANVYGNNIDISDRFHLQYVDIHQGMNNGRFVKFGMILVSNDGVHINKTSVWRPTSPDFSLCDIMVTDTWGQVITLDNDHPTIPSYMAAQGISLHNMFSVSTSGCPRLDRQGRYYMALYYYNADRRTDYSHPLKQLIGEPQTLRAAYEVSTCFQRLSDSVQWDNTIIQHGSGGRLVLSLDVMNTTGLSSSYAEVLCSSTVDFPQEIMPTNCTEIINGWSVDEVGILQTSILSFNESQGLTPVPSINETQGPALTLHVYSNQKRWIVKADYLQQVVYSFFSVMQKAYNMDYYMCYGADTVYDLKGYIGYEDPQILIVNMPDEVPANVSEALRFIDDMEMGMDAQIIQTDVNYRRSSLRFDYVNGPDSFVSQVQYTVSSDAFLQASIAAKSKINNWNLTTNLSDHQSVACGFEMAFKDARSYLHYADRQSVMLAQKNFIKNMLSKLAGYAARAIVLLRAIGQPDDATLVRFLNRTIWFAEHADIELQNDPYGPPLVFDALYSPDDVEDARNYRNASESCFPWPTFMQKFRSICSISHSANRSSTIAFKDDVCRTLQMRYIARNTWKNIGFRELRTMTYNGRCPRDYFKPEEGISKITRWSYSPSGMRVLYQGTIGLDKETVYWQKIAACKCQGCNSSNSTTYYNGTTPTY